MHSRQNDGILCLCMQKIGLKRDSRCINPCKSGDGSYLKKLTSPRGVEVGILGGQQIKSPGYVMNCPDNQYNLFFFNPSHTGGFRGGWGSTFQKSGKFHELSRKSIKKIPPTKGGRSGKFRGSTNQKSGKCHELPRKVITKINPTPPHQGLGVLKGNNFKRQTFHELEKIDIFC